MALAFYERLGVSTVLVMGGSGDLDWGHFGVVRIGAARLYPVLCQNSDLSK